MQDKWGGRRFILTCVTGAGTTILQWFGKLDAGGSTYALVMSAVVAAYITGNVVERKNAGIAAK